MKHFPSTFGDIYLSNTIDSLYPLLERVKYTTCFILCDSNTASLCLPLLQPGLQHTHTIIIPAGEENKTLQQCESIWQHLIEHGADRDSLVINVGGGMMTDLGGFAASCFQRGIRFFHIPTTVTAMTDAAIGGKVGVDFKDYKNYLGLYSSPEAIWINPIFIKTLPEAEIRSGLAEIIKHAVIGSPALWNELLRIATLDDIDWMHILELSMQVKLEATREDPFDRGKRKSLNFGHTIGHALESYFLQQGNPISHGHAVAYGMMAESNMAVELGMLSMTDFEKIIDCTHVLVRPPYISMPTAPELDYWMQRDKKNIAGMQSFSLPAGIGACRWDVRDADATAAISWLREHVSTSTFRLLNDHTQN